MLKSLKAIRPLIRRSYCNGSQGTDLKAILACKIEEERERVKKFRKENAKTKIGDVTVGTVYSGMRGVKGLLCDTSTVDPEEGITFRGLSIPDLQESLPKAEDGEQPLPEGIFWLLLTGDIPDCPQVIWLSEEWAARSKLPQHVEDFLRSVPPTVHPMAQLSAACNILSSESKFVKAYASGVPKTEYWEYYYEDAMDLIARVTVIASKIYRHAFKKGEGKLGDVDKDRDWAQNFCFMLGFDDPEFIELMRMHLTIHSDHEGGNVSAHTVHLVGSALSNAYIAYAAGMNGLAGPLHGLANQEVLIWLMKLKEELGEKPDKKQLTDFVWKTLKSGKVVPGYGHAVLRKTDPRYICQREFAMKHLPEDPFFHIVSNLYEVVPKVLTELGKVKNPWPNVDAHSGILLQYYCLTEMSFYTVLFAVSRALGVMSSIIWHRALLLPIERPKSISTNDLEKLVKSKSNEDKSSKDDKTKDCKPKEGKSKEGKSK